MISQVNFESTVHHARIIIANALSPLDIGDHQREILYNTFSQMLLDRNYQFKNPHTCIMHIEACGKLSLLDRSSQFRKIIAPHWETIRYLIVDNLRLQVRISKAGTLEKITNCWLLMKSPWIEKQLNENNLGDTLIKQIQLIPTSTTYQLDICLPEIPTKNLDVWLETLESTDLVEHPFGRQIEYFIFGRIPPGLDDCPRKQAFSTNEAEIVCSFFEIAAKSPQLLEDDHDTFLYLLLLVKNVYDKYPIAREKILRILSLHGNKCLSHLSINGAPDTKIEETCHSIFLKILSQDSLIDALENTDLKDPYSLLNTLYFLAENPILMSLKPKEAKRIFYETTKLYYLYSDLQKGIVASFEKLSSQGLLPHDISLVFENETFEFPSVLLTKIPFFELCCSTNLAAFQSIRQNWSDWLDAEPVKYAIMMNNDLPKEVIKAVIDNIIFNNREALKEFHPVDLWIVGDALCINEPEFYRYLFRMLYNHILRTDNTIEIKLILDLCDNYPSHGNEFESLIALCAVKKQLIISEQHLTYRNNNNAEISDENGDDSLPRRQSQFGIGKLLRKVKMKIFP